MKIKKKCFSTQLNELYGRDKYQSHIEVGREYWWYWPADSEIGKKYGANWHKIKVTYIRSNCMFYIFPDYPDIQEQFCPINCFLASTLVFAQIDPEVDVYNNSEFNIELDKIIYRFDDEHTEVINWPNEKEIEVDDDYLFNKLNATEYLFTKFFEVKDNDKDMDNTKRNDY